MIFKEDDLKNIVISTYIFGCFERNNFGLHLLFVQNARGRNRNARIKGCYLENGPRCTMKMSAKTKEPVYLGGGGGITSFDVCAFPNS